LSCQLREILRRYRHLRAIVTRHHSAALKFQAPDAILEQAKHIGLAAGHTLITDNEQELTVLFDLVIYNAKQGRSRAIDRYAKTAQTASRFRRSPHVGGIAPCTLRPLAGRAPARDNRAGDQQSAQPNRGLGSSMKVCG